MKSLKTALCALVLAGLALPAAAFEPERPECIAPANPGGGFDLTCRVAQRALEPALPSPMEVTFMPGGIGAVAYAHMNSNRIDDPNVIVALSSGSALNIAQGKFGADFDENDARWLASAGADFGAVIVREDSPYQTLGELMEAAKADPSGIVLGAGGSIGSQDWMKAALLMRSIGVDPRNLRYVAYEGGGASKAALLGGQIDVYTGDVSEMAGELGAGTMRILAVLSEERLPEPFAQFPTAREEGYDVVWTIFRGYYMGQDVSDEAYDWWVARFEELYADPRFAEIRAEQGLFEFNMAGAEFDAYVKEQVAFFRALAREAGLIQ